MLVDEGISILDRMEQAVSGMQSTVLMVQGPPGTGKPTFLPGPSYHSSSRDIELLYHPIVMKLSRTSSSVVTTLQKNPRQPAIVHKVSSRPKHPDQTPYHLATSNDDVMLFKSKIVGGTAWLFSRPEMIGEFDYLFVDEAGQVSLANLFGMSLCANNIVMDR